MIRARGPVSLALSLLLAGCATMPTNFARPVSHALTDTGNTRLGMAVGARARAHPGTSGFRVLGNGLDAFVARAVLADRAERSIDAQYFILHPDLTGKLFVDQLLKAADRGVRVRLLVDDMHMGGMDLGAGALDAHPNMEVRLFNPFSRKTSRTSQFVTRYGVVTRRMHNKSFTVDNQLTILGGRNIGDEYFQAHPDVAFSDLDVLVVGPMVNKVSGSFDRYWNSEMSYPATVLMDKPATRLQVAQKRAALRKFVAEQQNSAYLKALRESDLARQLERRELKFSWGEAEVVHDEPEKLLHSEDRKEYNLTPRLVPYIDALKKELIIFSPYFVPGKSGVKFLTGLVNRGVRVRILTNSLASNDVAIVHSGYAKYRKDLLRGGVELHELDMQLDSKTRKARRKKKARGRRKAAKKASLHAKSFLFDRRQVFIGSLNLDERSFYHNTEIGVIFTSPTIAAEMAEWFDKNIAEAAFRLELKKGRCGDYILWHGVDDGKPTVHDKEPHAGFWRRFGAGFMRMFPIDSQL